MSRNVVSRKQKAWSHRQRNVEKGLISQAELAAASGSKTFLSYWDFSRLYRQHIQGHLDVHGNPCDVHLDAADGLCEADEPSVLPADPSLAAACRLEDAGIIPGAQQRYSGCIKIWSLPKGCRLHTCHCL